MQCLQFGAALQRIFDLLVHHLWVGALAWSQPHVDLIDNMRHAAEPPDVTFRRLPLKLMRDETAERNDPVLDLHPDLLIRHRDVPSQNVQRAFGDLLIRVFMGRRWMNHDLLHNPSHTLDPLGGSLGVQFFSERADDAT